MKNWLPALLIGCFSSSMTTEAFSQPPAEAPEVARVRAALFEHLKDPVAAQIVLTKGPWRDTAKIMGQEKAGDFFCAKINARNSYGGYQGFKDYMIVVPERGQPYVWEISPVGLYQPDRVAHKKCAAQPE